MNNIVILLIIISNNILIILYGARWVLEISEGTLCKVYDCLTTMLTPESNIKQH